MYFVTELAAKIRNVSENYTYLIYVYIHTVHASKKFNDTRVYIHMCNTYLKCMSHTLNHVFAHVRMHGHTV